MFLVFEFVCGTPPSCLKVRGWVVGGLQHFWFLDLIGTWKRLGQGVWGQCMTIVSEHIYTLVAMDKLHGYCSELTRDHHCLSKLRTNCELKKNRMEVRL